MTDRDREPAKARHQAPAEARAAPPDRDSPDLIHPLERYVELAGHSDPDVRAWALRRLEVLDPDAAARAASLRLSDDDPEVLRCALDTLARRSVDATAEPLRRLLDRPSLLPGMRSTVLQALVRTGDAGGAELERLAEGLGSQFREAAWRTRADADPAGCRRDLLALLASEGSAVPVERLAGWLEILATVAEPDDAPALLARMADLPPDDAEAPAEALLDRCGADDMLPTDEDGEEGLLADLEQDCAACDIPLDELCPKTLRNRLAKALRGGRPREAIEAAWAAMIPRAEPEALAEPARWSRTVLAALASKDAPTDLEGRMAFALALADARRRLATETLHDPGVERLVRVRPLLDDVERETVDGEIVRRWQAGPDPTREDIGRLVTEDLGPKRLRGVRFAAIQLAGQLAGFPAARTVLEALADDWSSDERVRAGEVLAARPDDLRALASDYLLGHGEACSRVVLGALDLQPYRWAAATVALHLPSLLELELDEEVWNALADLGDPATIEAAVREWRPGESRIAAVIRLLSLVGHGETAIPREILREAAESRANWRRARPNMLGLLGRAIAADARGDKEIHDHKLDTVLDRPLWLDLRCNQCRRTYRYEVEGAFVHPDRNRCEKEGWDGIVLSRIIVCKNCGAQDDYRLTTSAQFAVLSRLMLRVAKGKPALDSEERVQVAETRLWDGTVVHRPSQALAHLRALAEASPDRAEPWRRLGNYARRYGRPEEAETVLRRAMDLDDTEVDAPHVLADILWDQGRLAEALPACLKAVERLGRSSYDLSQRGEVAEYVARFLKETSGAKGAPPALLVAWTAAKSGPDPVINLSQLDLRRFRHWEALAGFFASGNVIGLQASYERPTESPSTLEAKLAAADRDARAVLSTPPDRPARAPGQPAPATRQSQVGRNDPCPCGSGKKYKRCCGA